MPTFDGQASLALDRDHRPHPIHDDPTDLDSASRCKTCKYNVIHSSGQWIHATFSPLGVIEHWISEETQLRGELTHG